MFCSAVTGIQPNWRADLAQGVIDVRCLQQNQRPGVGFAKRTVTPTEEMRPVFLRGFDYLFGRRFTFEGDIFPKPCIFIIQENLHNWPYLRGTVPAYLSASKCNREAMRHRWPFKLKAKCGRMMYLVHAGVRFTPKWSKTWLGRSQQGQNKLKSLKLCT